MSTQPAEPQGLTVGAAAARLGVAPETLRSWGRRYGLGPSTHTTGGHRRYSQADVDLLVQMQRLVSTGHTPAEAARMVQESPAPGSAPSDDRPATPAPQPGRRRPGGPGGNVLAVPGAPPEARGLARAAARLDADAVHALLGDLLAERGTIATWDEVLRPVLVAAGQRWAETGGGVDIEHLLSEATTEALRAHRACQLRPVAGRSVLLTSPPGDWHVLPLHALAAALAEQRVPAQVMGQLPAAALGSAVRRTGASAVFVWSQRPSGPGVPVPELPMDALPRTRPAVRVVVGGPGWTDAPLPASVYRSVSLADAVRELQAAPR
ncbi:MerR family transcriptional regulator [Modestobacter sp. I12A-02628]|uniref:MerR family transcriptional regulator n=1 Tax=Goekera deserti TaxID=2497753 RepID=A0A7K3WHX1_9ACTN|nr:MerR family transcriptional regulator [Goekera deserti]MPR00384.1 MerR family transcriptional regulator [Goekera deserti]NDI50413.1 MerR family transcriptional regulator [Goekera deserti]NEL55320.1 MerR family transcriptional regulator [Goekera deserti]